MGNECVMANQFRWTSKSVERLDDDRNSSRRYKYNRDERTHYEGNRSNLKHVEATSMSHSNEVTSLNHFRASNALCHHVLVFLISSSGIDDTVRTGSSLNVVRFGKGIVPNFCMAQVSAA